MLHARSELSQIAGEHAGKAAELASELSALSYERKMVDRDREELDRALETLAHDQAQLADEKVHMQQYVQRLNELGREVQVRHISERIGSG